MLVLTRREGQSIKIGDNITITVVAGSTVRIGIDAPRDVKVVRDDIVKDVQYCRICGKPMGGGSGLVHRSCWNGGSRAKEMEPR